MKHPTIITIPWVVGVLVGACFISPVAVRAQSTPPSGVPTRNTAGKGGGISDTTPTVPQEEINRQMAEVASWVKKGKDELKQKRVEEAITAFKHALKLDSASSPAYRGLADAYTAKGDLTNAVQTYRALLYPAPGKQWTTSMSTDPVTLMRFALILNQSGKKDEALTVYREGLKYLNYTDGKPNTSTYPVLIDTTFDGRDSENVYTPARFEAAARTALAMKLRSNDSITYQDEINKELTRAMKANPRFGPAYLYYALTLKELARADKSITPEAVNAAFDVAAKMVHGTQAKAAVKAGREHY